MKKKSIQKKKIYKDTWSMDWSFTNWLEPRLKCYLKEGGKIVDLTYVSFTIDGETKTLEDWIKVMIPMCEELNKDDTWIDDDRSYKLQKLGRIWAEVLPAMWW